MRLRLQRHGLALPLTALWLLVTSVGAIFLFQARDAEREAEQRAVRGLRQQLASTPAHPAPPVLAPDLLRYTAFRSRLVDHAKEADALRTLFDTALADGLTLREGHYRYQRDEAGQYLALRVELPISGSYSSVRGFVHDALIALPGLSLRELHLKRDNVGDTALTAKLIFLLYEQPDGKAVLASEGKS